MKMNGRPTHGQVEALEEYANAFGLDWEIAYDMANEGEPPAFQLVGQNGKAEEKMAVIGETAEQAAATISLAAHAARGTLKPSPRYKVVTMGHEDGYGWRKRNPDVSRVTEQVIRNHFGMSNDRLASADRNRGSKALKLYIIAFNHGASLG